MPWRKFPPETLPSTSELRLRRHPDCFRRRFSCRKTRCEAYAAIHGVFLRLHSGDAAYSLQTGMAAMKQASISMPDRPETHPSFVFRCSVGLKWKQKGSGEGTNCPLHCPPASVIHSSRLCWQESSERTRWGEEGAQHWPGLWRFEKPSKRKML